MGKDRIPSQMSRCTTARVSGTRLFLVCPAKVKASKYILFTGGSPEVEIKITCLILLSRCGNMRYFLSNHIIC